MSAHPANTDQSNTGHPLAPPSPGAPRWAAHLADPTSFVPTDLARGATLPGAWSARWTADPDAPVLRFVGGEDRWMTAGELDERTRRAADVLADAGLRPGDRLVWSAGATADSVVALLAGLRLGAALVPANTAYTDRELSHVAGDVRPTVCVVERAEQAGWLRGAVPEARVLATGLSPLDGRPAPGGGSSERGGPGPAPGDPALLVFTSGTTGAPKGAVLSHANVLAGLRSLELAWRWSAHDRIVLALPVFHVHGLCAGLMGALLAGASVVVLDRFSPEAVLDAAVRHDATLFFGVPTMYHRLAASDRSGELARLRLCVSGSAALPAPLWQRLHDEAGISVLERYGMTETLLTVSNPYDGARRPGTVGLPLPGVEVRLEGCGDGPPGPGDEGQLLVRGPSIFSGYWERPAATESAFADGWFLTGDVVAVDDDGYLCIRGRRGDLVITGGFNVYPAEVEDVLLSHPSVAEVAVVGEPSEEWGETVVAWVVPATGPLPVEALEELAAERLAHYKRPRRYLVVDELPRNAMGKVQRDRLRSP